jgi:hypothetical protein
MKRKSCTFSKAKRGFNGSSSSISIIYLLIVIQKSNNNGGKQKRDADFTETATQEETFMLHSLVFDFGSARVEKSIAR